MQQIALYLFLSCAANPALKPPVQTDSDCKKATAGSSNWCSLQWSVLGETVLAALQLVWSYFDPEAMGFLPEHRLRQFVRKLGLPLGHPNPKLHWMMQVRFECWYHHGRRGLPFHKVFDALLHNKMGPQVCLTPASAGSLWVAVHSE